MLIISSYFSLALQVILGMKIIRARIRGLGDTVETQWFELSPRLNLFHFPEERGRSSFLQALATINPLLPCEQTRPFADFPLVGCRQGYSRKILPEKRTVALAIFNTTPDLVSELAAVSPHLFETDRIEVGRRLDYSRWVNFVEIASSTRWSEIAADIGRLAAWTREVAPRKAAHIEPLIQPLRGPDRIKDDTAQELLLWLQSLPREIEEISRERVELLRRAVRRADDFRLARRIVEDRLPIFAVLSGASGLPIFAPALERLEAEAKETGAGSGAVDLVADVNDQLEAMQLPGPRLRLEKAATGSLRLSSRPQLEEASDPQAALLWLQAATLLTVALCRAACGTEPVLLFDCPERSGAPPRQLADFIQAVAESCQCCCSYATTNIFARHKGIPRYTVADLTRTVY